MYENTAKIKINNKKKIKTHKIYKTYDTKTRKPSKKWKIKK